MVHPFITDAQATQKIQESYNEIVNSIGTGFQGTIKIADTPTEPGIYIPTESGTYANAGGLEYAPEGEDEGYLVMFIYDGDWTKKNVTPINFTPTGVVEEGNAQAVSGDKVAKALKPISDTQNSIIIRKNKFNSDNILEDTNINVVDTNANLLAQSGSKTAFIELKENTDYYFQMPNFNTRGYRVGLFDSLDVAPSPTINRIQNQSFNSAGWRYLCFGVEYQGDGGIDLDLIQLEEGTSPTDIVPYDEISLINQSQVNELQTRVDELDIEIDDEKYIHYVLGKNLFDFDDLLLGWGYSASTGYVENPDGIMSNKLYLSVGQITIQGVKPYSADRVRILAFNGRDELLFGDPITIDSNRVGSYTITAASKFINVAYFRICLQFETGFPFDKEISQLEYGDVATAYEAPIVKKAENPNYGKPIKTIFASGASTTVPSNGWFERACRELGFKSINAAVSGDSVMQHADKAFKGTLWTFEELDNMNILCLSHNHNYNVNFQGKEFRKVETFIGFYTTSGSFSLNNSWCMDKYNISNLDTSLLVSSVGSVSSEPYIVFMNQAGDILGNASMTFASDITLVEDFEITIPTNTAYVLIKRRNTPNSYTVLKGKTTGVLSNTVAEYENKGYDSSNNPLPLGTLDPNDPNQRLLPFGSVGASGSQLGNPIIDERYAAGYDYLIKKYRQECYNLKDNPASKWYGSEYGKPCTIIICSHWHDGYVVFNESAKKLSDRTGCVFVNTADYNGWSYKTTNPNDSNSIRWSAQVCHNASYGGSNDLHDEPINGIIYTNMGFHPTRDVNSEFNIRRANIFKDALNKILL